MVGEKQVAGRERFWEKLNGLMFQEGRGSPHRQLGWVVWWLPPLTGHMATSRAQQTIRKQVKLSPRKEERVMQGNGTRSQTSSVVCVVCVCVCVLCVCVSHGVLSSFNLHSMTVCPEKILLQCVVCHLEHHPLLNSCIYDYST